MRLNPLPQRTTPADFQLHPTHFDPPAPLPPSPTKSRTHSESIRITRPQVPPHMCTHARTIRYAGKRATMFLTTIILAASAIVANTLDGPFPHSWSRCYPADHTSFVLGRTLMDLWDDQGYQGSCKMLAAASSLLLCTCTCTGASEVYTYTCELFMRMHTQNERHCQWR